MVSARLDSQDRCGRRAPVTARTAGARRAGHGRDRGPRRALLRRGRGAASAASGLLDAPKRSRTIPIRSDANRSACLVSLSQCGARIERPTHRAGRLSPRPPYAGLESDRAASDSPRRRACCAQRHASMSAPRGVSIATAICNGRTPVYVRIQSRHAAPIVDQWAASNP